MKTFKQLTVGDAIFICDEGSMKYEKKEIYRVESKEVTFDYNDKVERLEVKAVKWESYYNKRRYLFTMESDAIRYCRAQLFKVLQSRIKTVKNAMSEVYKLREENFDRLNHDWTDRQINILERELVNL